MNTEAEAQDLIKNPEFFSNCKLQLLLELCGDLVFRDQQARKEEGSASCQRELAMATSKSGCCDIVGAGGTSGEGH